MPHQPESPSSKPLPFGVYSPWSTHKSRSFAFNLLAWCSFVLLQLYNNSSSSSSSILVLEQHDRRALYQSDTIVTFPWRCLVWRGVQKLMSFWAVWNAFHGEIFDRYYERWNMKPDQRLCRVIRNQHEIIFHKL